MKPKNTSTDNEIILKYFMLSKIITILSCLAIKEKNKKDKKRKYLYDKDSFGSFYLRPSYIVNVAKKLKLTNINLQDIDNFINDASKIYHPFLYSYVSKNDKILGVILSKEIINKFDNQ